MDGNEGFLMEVNICVELLWDDYDREIVFKVFIDNVEDFIQQIDKGKKMRERKVEEFQEVKCVYMVFKRVRKRF